MRAFEAHWKSNKSATRTNIILGSIGLLLGIPLSFAMGWLGLTLIIVASSLLCLMLIRHFNHIRAYRETKRFSSEISIKFSENQIEVKTIDGESRLKWSTYIKYLNTNEFLLLYMSPKVFSIIPKKALGDEAEEFVQFVKTKIGPENA